MLRKFGSHLRDQWMGATALFLVLCGGTAWAVDGPLAGKNTVGSEDIIANEVKSSDIGNGRILDRDIANEVITSAKIQNETLTQEDLQDLAWITITPATGWAESGIPPECTRDLDGFVHFRGGLENTLDSNPEEALSFELPVACQTPQARTVSGVTLDQISGAATGTYRGIVRPAGQIEIDTGLPPNSDIVSLDGITYSGDG